MSHVAADNRVSGSRLFWWAAAVIGVCHLPLLTLHFQELWRRGHYQFFPLLLAVMAYLFWQRWPQRAEPLEGIHRHSADLMMVAGLLCLSVGTVLSEPTFAMVSLLLTSGALLLYRFGREAVTQLFGAWMLGWLMVRPVLRLDERLIAAMQLQTSQITSVLLDLVGMEHLATGNVIHLPGKMLMVEEACSGVQSLFALLAATGILVTLKRLHWCPALLMLASAVLWAGLSNIVRVFAVAVGFAVFDVDLATGWMHEVLGFVVFILALGMVACTEHLIAFLGAPIDELSPLEEERSPFSVLWNYLVAGGDGRPVPKEAPLDESDPQPAVAVSLGQGRTMGLLATVSAFVVLFVLQSATYVVNNHVRPTLRREAAAVVASLHQESLPEDHDGWRQVDFQVAQRGVDSRWGAFSKQWIYQTEAFPATLSCDYPFEGWHELTTCYRGIGWQQLAEQRLVSDDASMPPALEVEFSRETGEYGYLIFGFFDAMGRDHLPSEANFTRRLKSRLARGPLGMTLWATGTPADLPTYQVQMFIVTGQRLSQQQKIRARQQYSDFRQTLKQHWESNRDVAMSESL